MRVGRLKPKRGERRGKAQDGDQVAWVRAGKDHLGRGVQVEAWGAIHLLLNIILQLRILVLLLESTLPYVV
jgi:hypothetical protein